LGREKSYSPSQQFVLLRRLQVEINSLGEEQMEALSLATTRGMTVDEAEEYDDRHDRIMKLVKKVAKLKGAE
jgi:hypothetical protein